MLTFHIAWRLRTWLAGGVLTLGLIGAAGGLSGFNTTTRQWGQPVSEDVLPIAHASLPGGGLPGAGDCAACHNDLTSQWRISIRAHAARDPYYQVLATCLRRSWTAVDR